jgi:hypothetical protein
VVTIRPRQYTGEIAPFVPDCSSLTTFASLLKETYDDEDNEL